MTTKIDYSYEKVNYLLRLKKQIERKIIIETLSNLSAFTNLEIQKSHYVGFGSIYFADFIMFHKYLNIDHMTSIENKKEHKRRFQFNKPFDFINLKICDSNTFLSKNLDWQEQLIIWLDYDESIQNSMISDVELISSKVKPNDILLVTVEAETGMDAEDLIEFKENYSLYLNSNVKLKNIKEYFPEALRSIMVSSVQNGLRSQTENIEFVQLFNLTYRDTKKMYTFGVIFSDKEGSKKIKKILKNLNIVSSDTIVDIDCPTVSPKEKMHMDSLIKLNRKLSYSPKKEIGIGLDLANKYCKYYKYYPQFFESIY